MDFESSSFENLEYNSVIPANGLNTELLSFQSNTSLVYKTKINNKWLLLKRLKPEYKELPQYIDAIEKEFRIGFNLDNPHIVKYLNKGTDAKGTYLIAEFVDGLTLRELLQKSPNGISDKQLTKRIFAQLLDALEYLHKQQIYHLDLKPENIIITHKGDNVKIIDFGLSGTDSYISIASGTKKYCAPEQIDNPDNTDARSDIYSLGLILLELLTGKTDTSELKRISIRYRKIISKCIEPIQERRFNSIEQVNYLFAKKRLPLNWLLLTIANFLFFGFGAYIIVTLFVVKNQPINNQLNPNFSSNTKPTSQIVDSFSTEINIAKKSLKSIFSKSNALKNKPIAKLDSIYCCKMGLKNYTDFLDSMKIINSKPRWRNQLNLKTNCNHEITRNNFDSILNYISKKYKNNEFAKYKLLLLYKESCKTSNQRIDSLLSLKNSH